MAYATISKPGLHFNTKLYTGTGSSNALTGVGFQPDWVWIKERNGGGGHNIFDAVRGTTKVIYSNGTYAESTEAQGLTAFGTDGFTLGTNTNVNENGINHVAWNWKANGSGSANTDGSINTTYTSVNTTAGFSISKYTGNATSGATIGHGLGVAPKMILIKGLGTTYNWIVGHNSLSTNWSKYLTLSTTDAEATATNIFNDTAPTSSVFSIGNALGVNTNSSDYIAYCFAEKTGYSKFGSYTGNGNADGTFVYTGFKPAFVLVKNTQQSADSWFIWDNKRPGYNQIQKYLSPNNANAEADSSSYAIDTLSNGFKVRASTGAINNNNEKMIYMAFAAEPLVANVGASIPATAR